MDKDYYQTLGTVRLCSQQQIADSYRKLALRWHPKLAKQDAATSSYHFSEIAQAYDVLSDPIKRAYYDKYGWKKLKEGLYQQGGLKGGYRFGDNAQEIFLKFFHSNNTFNQVFDKEIKTEGSLFGQAFGALNYQNPNTNPDVVVEVNCSLADLYTGTSKKIAYQHQKLNPDGRTLSVQTTQKLIQIKPGFSQKNSLRFEGEGNQTISKQKSDLVCKIVQIPHKLYERKNNDLTYTATISLIDALSCCPIQLITLDNRKLRISLDQIVSPNNVKEVNNEGMPICNQPKKRGNLFIKFNIIFPTVLSLQKRKQIRALLE